jgi:hypothetical protein
MEESHGCLKEEGGKRKNGDEKGRKGKIGWEKSKKRGTWDGRNP